MKIIKISVIVSIIIVIFSPFFILAQEGDEINEEEDIEEKKDPKIITADVDENNFTGTYKIGTVQSMSGDLSYQGKSMVEAIALYFDLINEKGGIGKNKIEVIAYDDGSNPSITLEKTKKLVEEDYVQAIIGSTSVSTALAVIDYINRSDITYVHFGGGSVSLMEQAGENVFFLQPTVTMEAMVMTEFAYNSLYGRSLMVIYQDDEFGYRSRNATRVYSENNYMYVVDEVKVNEDNIPYQKILSDALNLSPEVILMYTYMSEANKILTHLRNHNIEIPVVLPSFNLDYVTIGTIGKENWNSTYSGKWLKSSKEEVVQDFITLFRERKLIYPNYFHSIGWALCDIIAEGKRQTVNIYEKLYDNIKLIYSWDEGISSRISFDNPYNVGIDSMYFVGFKDGNFFDYSSFITPQLTSFYTKKGILGVVVNDNPTDKNDEYILDPKYKDFVSKTFELINKLNEEKTGVDNISKENEETTNTTNDNKEYDSSFYSPISGDDLEEDKDSTNDDNKEEKSENLVYKTYDENTLFGKWESTIIGSKLKESKYDGKIVLSFKEDNRYYMTVKKDKKTNEYNGYWEIVKNDENEKMLLLDQFIPEANLTKSYFIITNSGKLLKLILSEAEDIPSLKNYKKRPTSSSDYFSQTITFSKKS
jgi:ABC-type branched-subunit amino acid transport system substrate-binding protein